MATNLNGGEAAGDTQASSLERQTVATTCATTQNSQGSATLCIESPPPNAELRGDQIVTATVTTTGMVDRIRKLVFSLDGEYLLTDYEPPYTFKLPSDRFADGQRTLSVVATFNNGPVSAPASVSVVFANGNVEAPTNTNTFTPYVPPPPPDGEPLIVAATGDGASGETPEVTDYIASRGPDMFIYLGDVYDKGTYTEFYNWYGMDEYFGQFRHITNPTVGNHEYENGVAPGYFDYWDNVPDYYSLDAAGWHFISLNTMLRNETEMGRAQYEWLQNDLAASTAECALAFFHHPRYSIGSQGDRPEIDDLWTLLVRNGVDIVLTGHDHNYQRWRPLDSSGNPAPDGIVQFIAGAGGHGIREFVRTDTRVAFGMDRLDSAYGALWLALYEDRAEFEYVNIEGRILDAGTITCSHAPEEEMTFYVRSQSDVNVRSCPETTCTRIGTLAPGTEVIVAGEAVGEHVLGSEIWYKVIVEGETAYIHSSLLYQAP